MNRPSVLFTSREVRWFLRGTREQHAAFVDWFTNAAPFQRHGDTPPPAWRGRRGDEPDVYLVVPGARDMGIKWREGLLQIKGRTANPGETAFGRHVGRTECWAKWSYDALPAPWRALFEDGAPPRQLDRVAVHKQRLLRMFELRTGEAAVERDPDQYVARGVGAELAAVSVGGQQFLTLGFEASPDDGPVAASFDAFVSAFLEGLDAVALDADASLSYPAWLCGRS